MGSKSNSKTKTGAGNKQTQGRDEHLCQIKAANQAMVIPKELPIRRWKEGTRAGRVLRVEQPQSNENVDYLFLGAFFEKVNIPGLSQRKDLTDAEKEKALRNSQTVVALFAQPVAAAATLDAVCCV